MSVPCGVALRQPWLDWAVAGRLSRFGRLYSLYSHIAYEISYKEARRHLLLAPSCTSSPSECARCVAS